MKGPTQKKIIMDTSPIHKLVVNLSKYKVTDDHLSLLSKGLNFYSTPDDPGQHREDFDNFHRRLQGLPFSLSLIF